MTLLYWLAGIIPIPIPAGGGKLPASGPLAIYLSLMVFIILGMVIRFLVIRRSEHFKKQSAVKNFFFELNSFSYLKPDMTVLTQIFIGVNGLSLFLLMVEFFIKALA